MNLTAMASAIEKLELDQQPVIMSHQEQVYVNCVTNAVAAQVKFKAATERLKQMKDGKKLPAFLIKQAC